MWSYYSIGDILNSWADQGVFAYVLPFLLIFAIVFGILSKTKLLGDNKGVQATIALAVGLLALQFNIVTQFYATIFPYTGIAIAILLVALLLMGLISDKKDLSWVWFGIGAILFLVVLMGSLTNFSYFSPWLGSGWAESWPAIMVIIVVLGLIAWVVFSKKT